jgi:hypothetical protein
MEGFKYNVGDPQRGIIPRSMEEISSSSVEMLYR